MSFYIDLNLSNILTEKSDLPRLGLLLVYYNTDSGVFMVKDENGDERTFSSYLGVTESAGITDEVQAEIDALQDSEASLRLEDNKLDDKIEALEDLFYQELTSFADGKLEIMITDHGEAKDANIIITNSLDEESFNGNTTDGELVIRLPFGKYDVKLVSPDHDVLSSTTIVDTKEVDNLLVGNTCENIDIGLFKSTILFDIEPSLLPDLKTVSINNGDASSSNKYLTLSLDVEGVVDQILVSKDPNFTGGSWVDYTIGETFTYVYDYVNDIDVTLYVKARNSIGESVVVQDEISMTNGITRSDSSKSYNLILDCINDLIDEYPNGLTEDVVVEVISDVFNTAGIKFLKEISDFNLNSDFYLHIKANNRLTIDCSTNGGFRLDDCNNIIFSGINFINVSSMQDHSVPEQVCAFFFKNCENIVVNSCSFDGRYLSDESILGRYALVSSETNNLTISDCDFKYFALKPITISDCTTLMFLKNTMSECLIQRYIISQPALIELKNIDNLIVNDCIIDGNGMDTIFSGHNIARSCFDRSELKNCPGEIIAFTNTSTCEIISIKNTLIYNNLTHPYYYWTKQHIALGNVEVVELINNTVVLTPINGTDYYATLIRCTERIGSLYMRNNVFDFQMQVFEENKGNSVVVNSPTIENLDSDYNLYRDYSLNLDLISNIMILMDDINDNIDNKRINSLSELHGLAVPSDLNSVVIDIETPLFVGGDFKVLTNDVLALPIDSSALQLYDINKNLVNVTGNLGCQFKDALVDSDTTVIKYNGINLFDNTTFDETDVNKELYSKSEIILTVNKYNDIEIYKWIFEDNFGGNKVLFGNTISTNLTSQVDVDGNYTGETSYSLEITKINI